MTWRNMRFPTGIRYGAISGPAFKTTITQLASGKSQRNRDRTYPLRKFSVERGLRTDDLRNSFIDFFNNCHGRADTFRVKDFNDYVVASGQGVFTNLGSARFQMWKRYTSNGYTTDIPVYLPVSGTILIPGLTEGVHWSADYTVPSGIITLLGSPTIASPTSWTGQYDVHSRFDTDELPITIDDQELYTAQSINIVEEPDIT